ncbi:MAG: integrase core domain-containing protein, partial [Holophagales bacterium]|nr:integrase core domain-containing protein [Holophagales bacterium]
ANGQKLKCLTLVDEYTRECQAIEVGATMPSSRVIAVLDRLIREHGAPEFLRSDNGPEFLSKALRRWLAKRNVKPAFIEPGKPWQNGSVESFHDKLRDECLNQEWFRSRSEAAIVIGAWRRHCNGARPHSSLGYRTPNEYKNDLARTGRDTSFDH